MTDKELESAVLKGQYQKSGGIKIFAVIVMILLIASVTFFGWWFLFNGGAQIIDDIVNPYIYIGNVGYDKNLTEITLSGTDIEDYSILNQFKYLKKIDIKGQNISCEKYDEISEQLSGKEILWRVPMGSSKFDCNAESISLSNDIPDDELCNIRYFTSLKTIKNEDRQLDDELYAVLKPILVSGSDCKFICSTSVSGVELNNDTEEIILNNKKMSDTVELENAIRFFPKLKKIEMCGCGLSNDTMGSLREKYPDIDFIWTISFLRYRVRTDALVFSTLVDIDESHEGNQDTFAPLFKYCTELRALDLGHHYITDISEIANLKKLQVLILTDNLIENISPLAELHDLNYVEICFNRFTDVTPLTKLKKLEDLNVCYCKRIKNPVELKKCKELKRLYISHSGLKISQIKELGAGLPEGCEYNTWVENAVNEGWRNNAKNKAIRRTFGKWNKVKTYESWSNVTYE